MDRVEFVPGQSLPLFELKPPVFEGIDFFVKRTFDIVGSALLILRAVARCSRRSRWRSSSTSRGRRDLPLAPARASAARRSTASSSARCTRTPSTARPSSRS